MEKTRTTRFALAVVLAVALAATGITLAPAAETVLGMDGAGKAYAAAPKLSLKKKTVDAGKTFTLTVKNASKKKVVWKSSNKKIATVSAKGVVKGKKQGTCTITAKVGKKSLKCKVTVKAALNLKQAKIVKGNSVTLKVMGISGKAKWSTSNKKVASVTAKGKVTAKKAGTATITAKVGKKSFKCKVTVEKRLEPGPGLGKAYKKPTTDSQKKLVQKISGYSYKVTPVNGKFNNIFFVETDNPDPNSFQFVDESGKYLGKGETALLKPLSYTYYDVQYSNKKTRRIANKGYLFYCYECNTDGGTLRLVANEGYYYQGTSFGASYNDGTNYDTGKAVAVAALEDRVDYLIRTYAAGKSSFWDKLDAVETGLNQIALYPKRLLDSSKPNASAYPTLACSPYPELSWNEHIESMYQTADDGLFLDAAYGFVLDSLSFPGTMGSVATRLNSSCTVSAGWSHAYIDVTYNGKTSMYGGAGSGGSEPLYSKFVNWKFKFDGTDKGYGTGPSLDVMRAARIGCTDSSNALAQQYLDQISMASVAKAVGQGAWVRVAYEGFLGGGQTIGYATASPYNGTVSPASNAWVDGRYINEYERWEPDAKFSDHPQAKIILSNVSYTRKDGTPVTGNVTYDYNRDTDDWRAAYFYTGMYVCAVSEIQNLHTLSPSLVLTRAQVNSMVSSGQIDGKTSVVPKAGYIFDGSAKPGTYTNDLSKV